MKINLAMQDAEDISTVEHAAETLDEFHAVVRRAADEGSFIDVTAMGGQEGRAMKVKDYDLLLSFAEEVLSGFQDRGDHYEYTGSMNSVDTLRELVRKARCAYDHDRIMKENGRARRVFVNPNCIQWFSEVATR